MLEITSASTTEFFTKDKPLQLTLNQQHDHAFSCGLNTEYIDISSPRLLKSEKPQCKIHFWNTIVP